MSIPSHRCCTSRAAATSSSSSEPPSCTSSGLSRAPASDVNQASCVAGPPVSGFSGSVATALARKAEAGSMGE
eukprot:scaffold50644_cov69-Phaeocystis_antarctica.AAC.4